MYTARARRKCESNALFRNDDTLRAAEKICRGAIEEYYGRDALERFRAKEKKANDSLGAIYEDPLWEALDESIDQLIATFSEDAKEEAKRPAKAEEAVEVTIFRPAPDGELYYGMCPRCEEEFDYDEVDLGRTVRCRHCALLMRLLRATGTEV